MTKLKKKTAQRPAIVKEQNLPAVQQSNQAVAVQQYDPSSLIAMGMQKGMNLEQLDKLIDMQERFMKNRAREAYFKAFAEFQRNGPSLKKNKVALFAYKDEHDKKVSYQYQTLDDIASHIREPLAACGLSYNWGQKEEGTNISVWCIIKHVDGHEEIGPPLSAALDTSGKKSPIHAKASTISYLRRYTLTGILGLSSADGDDDAKAASKAQPVDLGKEAMPPEQEKVTMKQISTGATTVERVKEYYTLSPDQEASFQIAEDQFKKSNPNAKA